MRKVIGILVLLMLIATPVSALILDDADAWIDDKITTIVNSARSLSIIGEQRVSCADGTTSCIMVGDIITIRSDVQAGEQALKLVVPSGTTFALADRTVKTTDSITLTLTPRAPYMTKPMAINNNEYKYYICDTFACLFPSDKYLTAYTPYGDAVVTTMYMIQLTDKYGTTAIQKVSYNFNNPTMTNDISIRDNAGITANVTAKSQQSTGMVFDVGYIVIVPDNYGVGGYSIFDRTDFKRYLDDQYSIERWRYDGWNRPKSWTEFLSRMKSRGLRTLPVGYGSTPYIFTGTTLIVNYEERHVGTSVESRFPKTMVSYVEELLFSGQPRIVSMSLVPDTIKPGVGDITASVDVYNDGSTDVISVGVPSSYGFTSQLISGNNIRLNKGEHYVYIFRITPTTEVTSDTKYTVTAIATAQGSGKYDTESRQYNLQPRPREGATEQIVLVTAYTPDKTVLENAPILQNQVQVGSGVYKKSLPLGKYVFSTNNLSNVKYFAPNPVEIELTGGDMKIVNLYFSNTPVGDDYTWIFWLVVAVIVVLFAWYSGFAKAIIANPYLIIPIVLLIVILWLLWVVLQAVLAVAEVGQNVWDFVTTLGGILK